jgi:sarcosine/dimethylglycine N-methyltransferase
MNDHATTVVATARDYYNSHDADQFYFLIWGGEDIHIGLYEQEQDPIRTASHRTVMKLAEQATQLQAGARVIDLGSGYGGAARYLAQTFGCHVTALNLSETENERHRMLNQSQGLDHLIDVIDGSFEDIPAADASFDVVWSQDAILHSGRREQVVAEIARVLRPNGELLFTDPMQADDCPDGVLQPVLERIHLDSLGSVAFYRRVAAQMGLVEVSTNLMTEQLVNHYSRVRQELQRQWAVLTNHISNDYLERMDTGLGHWIDAGRQGYLNWGLLHFRKQA